MALTNCRVVLVRPEIAANIGATARAMRNFGLRELVLVAPVADPTADEARRLSTHGESILDACRIVGDLSEAVADCVFVSATSARTGGLYRNEIRDTPEQVMPRMVAALQSGSAAVVFGPEPSGLTNEEISRCHALIHLPADSEFPVLNLAQSAVVCLYELRRHWTIAVGESEVTESSASYAEQEKMFEHLRRALEQIHFLYGEKADSLMHAVRRLIGKAAPTSMEIKLLHGLARQMEWIAANRPPP
jgi:tRNA/rRNA methyltransferase